MIKAPKNKSVIVIAAITMIVVLSIGLGMELTWYHELERENTKNSIENAKQNSPVYVQVLQEQLKPYGISLVRDADEPVSEGRGKTYIESLGFTADLEDIEEL